MELFSSSGRSRQWPPHFCGFENDTRLCNSKPGPHENWVTFLTTQWNSMRRFNLSFRPLKTHDTVTYWPTSVNQSWFESDFAHALPTTTLQSKMNAKLNPHRFWPCHENGLIKTIPMIPHNLYVSFKLTSLYCGLRIILVYPNPQ